MASTPFSPGPALAAACAVLVLAGCRDQAPVPTASHAPDVPLGAAQPVDQGINPYDTWVTYDATREQVAQVSLAEPVLDAATQQPVREITLAQPAQTLHTEAGYDAYGTTRVNEYRQAPAADPYEQPVDETRHVQAVGDQVTGYGADGEVTVAAEESDVAAAPLAELGSLAGAQVTEGVIMSRRDAETVIVYGISPTRMPHLHTPGGTTRVERAANGRIRIVTTLASAPSAEVLADAPAAAPAAREETRVTRSYAARADRYVLEQVEVDVQSATERGRMRMRQTLRVRNVRWHENRQKDAERRALRERTPAGGGAATAFELPAGGAGRECMTSVFRPSCTGGGGDDGSGGGPGSTDPCAGADPASRSVVFQHGGFSRGETWGRMIPWMKEDFYLGCVLTPDLDADNRLAIQANDLTTRLQATGRTGYVLVGHSQGGLISRYVAQRNPSLVHGVVTLGTPHHGVPIASSARAAVLAGLTGVSALAASGCAERTGLLGCSRTAGFVAFAVPMLASIAMDAGIESYKDVKPGSDFIQALNTPAEAFPRVGIQHYPKKLWIEWRLYGDFRDVPDGPNGGRVEWKRANGVFLTNTACGVVGVLIGATGTAARCATRAGGMLATTAFWNVMTAGLGKTDGIVPGRSQIYPNALRNYDIPRGDSHVGETRSDKTRDMLRQSLSIYMETRKKDTW